MNKKEFIKELKNHLKHLQKEELDEIVADYEEHFQIGSEEGRSEKEIVKSLGKPKTIAKHVKAEHLVKKAEDETSTKSVLRAVLASLGLGFFNLVFVLGPFLGIVGVLIGITGAGLGLTIGGIGALFFLLTGIATSGISLKASFFISIGITTLGLLILIANFYIARFFGKLVLKYLKLNLKIIKPEARK